MNYGKYIFLAAIVIIIVALNLYTREGFDDTQCETGVDPLDMSMQSTLGQIKEQHRQMCEYMRQNYQTLYPNNKWAIDAFIPTYYNKTNPSKMPAALIWFLASWNGFVPKMNTCDMTLTIPVIFCNCLFELYFMDYDTMRQNYGYIIKTQDDYLRIKRIYMNAYNMKNQYDPKFLNPSTKIACERNRMNIMKPLLDAVNKDVATFVTNYKDAYPQSSATILDVNKYKPKPIPKWCRYYNRGACYGRNY